MPSWKESNLRPLGRLIHSPTTRSHQSGVGPRGKNKFFTFKAGMYMKTKDSKTNCPFYVGHLRRYDIP